MTENFITQALGARLQNLHITAIIPAYNEAPRIGVVLDAVCKYPYISEVIVVNDGSTDDTAQVVRKFAKKCSKLKLVDLKNNQGKTKAMLEGVKHAQNADILVFLDADLRSLPHEYLDKLLYYLVEKNYDMTILDRLSDRSGPFGILALARFFGGERAVWKKDFVQIDFSDTKGYEIESTINLWYLQNNKRVRTIFAPKLHSAWQFKKWGTLTALKRYLKMFWGIYKKYGARNFYMQVLEFDDDTLIELYDWYKKQKNKKILGKVAKVVLTAGVAVGTVAVTVYAIKKQLEEKLRKGRG